MCCVLHRATGLPTGMSHRAACAWVESSSIDSGPVALWPCTFCTDPLEGIQRRAARFVIQDHSRFTSVSLLLKDLNWAPLKDRRRDIRLAMLFKIVKCNMPAQAEDILLPADPRTRHHHSFKFKHIQSHTIQYRHSFFVRTVPEWNSLSEACVNADTITAFQTQLHYAP